MKIQPTELAGAFILDVEPSHDVRGFFARTWCRDELLEHGLTAAIAQCSLSFNEKRGTLRGLHLQTHPYEEVKIVRCTSGSIFDVIVDLRAGSATFGRWISVELSAGNRRSLYVPEGFAHGFQTLEEATEVFYQISVPYNAEYRAGVRWNDPRLTIPWPIENVIVSVGDQELPLVDTFRQGSE